MKQRTKPSDDAFSRGQRILLAAVAAGGLLLLMAARYLEPDPRGFGTHEQLGLTPCYFRQSTGHICPTCGMTTAWAHALRGDIGRAASTNLGGALLCLLVLWGAPWLMISTIMGRPWGVKLAPKVLLVIATAWLAVTLLDWLRRWFMS
ncbi:MAG: DUF2752 domain-containing protein [Pirellulales bacterium]|nr:DUF2752 domain-containing protein [Pirellulales bacterium]